MIINQVALLQLKPIKDMLSHKASHLGVTYGLSEAGYDIRIKQSIWFNPGVNRMQRISPDDCTEEARAGRFILASAIEEFQMPDNLTGIVHDKSTWARRGLSVFNTVIEPGWEGFLTLELVYHGQSELIIPAGSGIAQVVFHQNAQSVAYTGRYQGQADSPVEAICAA